MSFLQPILVLAGLPLVALPIIIHLINRQRHRTVAWGAMLFLLDAKRMTRGIARLRYWLIMMMRMLAVAALVFVAGRPLATGRVGLVLGGPPDTTIVILDRSCSMEQQNVETGESKRSTGLQKLAELIRTVGSRTRVVLIENGENQAERIESAESLLKLPMTSGTETCADIPAMLQTALDYVTANQTGRTDIWVCSDLRESDWRYEDGRWPGVREGFGRLEGVRFYLLSYPDNAPENLAVWVDHIQRSGTDQNDQLVMDVTLRRGASSSGARTELPVEFIINGARSVVNVEMMDGKFELQGHAIPLDETIRHGWGRVELPADANLQDNVFYFVFGDEPPRHTTIVSDDPRTAEPLRLAAISPVDPGLAFSANTLTSDQIGALDWEATTLLIWQSAIPDESAARRLEAFVASGRTLIFLPPDEPGRAGMSGVRWGRWREAEGEDPIRVASWRGDSDLLMKTESGSPLPVGKLEVRRYCTLQGTAQSLAAFGDGAPLLARVETGKGAFYMCSTLPRPADSNLLRDGVVLYVMIHRALALGAEAQSNVHQLTAGSDMSHQVSSWQTLDQADPEALSSSRWLHGGAFRSGDTLAALNRPEREDRPKTLDDDAVSRLFQGLDYRQVKQRIGSAASLASEIWRVFVVLMALALIVEAWLCLPEKAAGGTSPAAGNS